MSMKSLHQPVSPYTSSVYNALCTVVQAVPLAALFWMLWNKPSGGGSTFYDELSQVATFDPGVAKIAFSGRLVVEYGKIIIVLWLINAIWHRYVIDDQFAAWRLRIRDTIIPFAFSACQAFLALSIQSDTKWFALWIFALTMIGLVAYGCVTRSFATAEAQQLFDEHFADNERGEQMYNIVKVHFSRLYRIMKVSSVATAVIVVILWVLPHIKELPFDPDDLRIYNLDFVVLFITTSFILIALMRDRLAATLPDALVSPLVNPNPLKFPWRTTG
jgi:hypothetical protein